MTENKQAGKTPTPATRPTRKPKPTESPKQVLEMHAGYTATAQAVAGGRVRFVVECADTEDNRAAVEEALYLLEDGDAGYVAARKRGPVPVPAPVNFPGLTYDRMSGIDHKGVRFWIREDHYGGYPLFETFDGRVDDHVNALRLIDCWNRFTGISGPELDSFPHVGDIVAAYDYLKHAARDVLEGKGDMDDLKYALQEARYYFSGAPRRGCARGDWADEPEE